MPCSKVHSLLYVRFQEKKYILIPETFMEPTMFEALDQLLLASYLCFKINLFPLVHVCSGRLNLPQRSLGFVV